SRAGRPPPRPRAEARDRRHAPLEPADAPVPARGDRGPGGGRPAAAAPRVRAVAAARGLRVRRLARVAHPAGPDPDVLLNVAARPRALGRRARPLARDRGPGGAPPHPSGGEPAALLARRTPGH